MAQWLRRWGMEGMDKALPMDLPTLMAGMHMTGILPYCLVQRVGSTSVDYRLAMPPGIPVPIVLTGMEVSSTTARVLAAGMKVSGAAGSLQGEFRPLSNSELGEGRKREAPVGLWPVDTPQETPVAAFVTRAALAQARATHLRRQVSL